MSPSPNPSADVAAPLSTSALKDRLRAAVRQIPDFPKPGILFEDILPIFSDPVLHQGLITALVSHCNTHFSGSPGSQPRIDAVVALESRGFLFGPSLALQLGVPFIPVRKQGKLPGECVSAEYQKEYGPDIFEMQVDTIRPGWGVIVVDDLIATGMCLNQTIPSFFFEFGPAIRTSRAPRRDTGTAYFASIVFTFLTDLPSCPRWIRPGSGQTREIVGWQPLGLHLPSRAGVVERPHTARCSRTHLAQLTMMFRNINVPFPQALQPFPLPKYNAAASQRKIFLPCRFSVSPSPVISFHSFCI